MKVDHNFVYVEVGTGDLDCINEEMFADRERLTESDWPGIRRKKVMPLHRDTLIIGPYFVLSGFWG